MTILHYVAIMSCAVWIGGRVIGEYGIIKASDGACFVARSAHLVSACYVFWYLISGGAR